MAAGKVALLTVPVVATAALTQYRAVTGLGAVPAAAARSLGIATVSAAIGERVGVDVDGTTIAEAGAAFAVDVALELDAAGRVITKAAGVTVGRAMQAAAGAGSLVEILLIAN
jgi:hypothetical protein